MERKKRAPESGIVASRRAATDFLKAGRRKELRAEDGWDLHNRFSHMSDEDFDRAVADGTITRDQIEKAGRNAYEDYMLDVWSETDQADEMEQPSYEEFMANPEKYGYDSETAARNDASEYPDRYYRYKPDRYYRYKPGRYPDARSEAVPAERLPAPAVPEDGAARADVTAVAKKPVPKR